MNSFRRCELSLLDSANYQDPLDLLRRFIPTPYRTRFRVGATSVVVETNDFSLLPELPLELAFDAFFPSTLAWKLVRDADARGLLQEPLHLISGQLTIVAMGAACLLGIDRERRELLGFIGAEVDPRTFHESLVPLLCRLSLEMVETNQEVCVEHLNEDVADA
jgi:hypothetical protein